MDQTPPDIKACWLPVTRTLQAHARSRGLAILKLVVLVNQDGNPVVWLKPEKTEIHPMGNAGKVLEMLEKMQ